MSVVHADPSLQLDWSLPQQPLPSNHWQHKVVRTACDSAVIAGKLWACHLPHRCVKQPCLCPHSNMPQSAGIGPVFCMLQGIVPLGECNT